MIAIVDYGMGNLRSVEKAFEKEGAHVTVTDSPRVLACAAGIVLPGVGAFGEAVRRLRAKRLFGLLQEMLQQQRPFLGICLGLQLLFERSEESPGVKGFGFLKGPVIRFKGPSLRRLKVPHMGWNTLRLSAGPRPACLKGIQSENHFYFVHSYYPEPQNQRVVATTTVYGKPFCSSVSQESLFACQFHPEKSGEVGLRIIRNYITQVGSC